jgi:hypothetical protein
MRVAAGSAAWQGNLRTVNVGAVSGWVFGA